MLQFCTCHDSSAVVACAKLWHDGIARIKIRTEKNFIRFQLWHDEISVMGSWSVCKTGPWPLNLHSERSLPAWCYFLCLSDRMNATAFEPESPHLDPDRPPSGRYIDTLGPGQNGRHSADNIFNWIFLNKFVCIFTKILQRFVLKGLALVANGLLRVKCLVLNTYRWQVHLSSLGHNELTSALH